MFPRFLRGSSTAEYAKAHAITLLECLSPFGVIDGEYPLAFRLFQEFVGVVNQFLPPSLPEFVIVLAADAAPVDEAGFHQCGKRLRNIWTAANLHLLVYLRDGFRTIAEDFEDLLAGIAVKGTKAVVE